MDAKLPLRRFQIFGVANWLMASSRKSMWVSSIPARIQTIHDYPQQSFRLFWQIFLSSQIPLDQKLLVSVPETKYIRSTFPVPSSTSKGKVASWSEKMPTWSLQNGTHVWHQADVGYYAKHQMCAAILVMKEVPLTKWQVTHRIHQLVQPWSAIYYPLWTGWKPQWLTNQYWSIINHLLTNWPFLIVNPWFAIIHR